jgi:hypothetical protein
MARTVTQIALDPGDSSAQNPTVLYALANDGTMWAKQNVGRQVLHQPDQSEQPWVQIVNILQT